MDGRADPQAEKDRNSRVDGLADRERQKHQSRWMRICEQNKTASVHMLKITETKKYWG